MPVFMSLCIRVYHYLMFIFSWQIGGIHPENCRLLKADSSTGYALSPDLLSEAVSHDIANGLIPFFLCANVRSKTSYISLLSICVF